jgi:CBS domain-containing protein
MASIVKNLMPESQTLVAAREEMTIQDALELMVEHDFSQLPVIDDDFKLKGLITSDSILRTVSYFKSTLDKIKVSHAIDIVKTCREDDELSELLNGLKDASAIPVVDKSGKLIAIVTNYDTAEYYRQRAEDMMLAEEIETSLRYCVALSRGRC